MADNLEHPPEVCILFITPKEFELAVTRNQENRRRIRADMVYRRKVIHNHLGVRDASLLTNRVVGDRLRAQRNQTGKRIRIDSMRRKPALVQTDHRAQVAARTVPGHKNLVWVAAIFPDVLHGPRDSCGCILDVRWRLHIRVETITRRNDGDAFVFQAIRNPAAPTRQPATVEPDHRRKAVALRMMHIDTAAGIDSLVVLWILPVGKVTDGGVRHLL